MSSIILKRGFEKKLAGLYPWIFQDQVSNESVIATADNGDIVSIQSFKGDLLGFAYIDKDSKIVARVISFDKKFKEADEGFFTNKLLDAYKLRERNFNKPYYRLVNSEGDNLPGLVIDRFGDVFSCQLNNSGITAFKTSILAALNNLFRPQGIVIRSYDRKQAEIIGTVPNPLVLQENELTFEADLINGQKTGWYYDQRENRREIARYCKQQRILDVFSYNGAFGIYAGASGAQEVTLIDSSESALALASANAKLNNLSCKFNVIKSDAFKALETLACKGEKYGVIILDPPPFIKNKSNKFTGVRGYEKLASLAAKLLDKNGILFYAACSHHMSLRNLIGATKKAFNLEGRDLNILFSSAHAADHPICKALPESHYLNAFIAKPT